MLKSRHMISMISMITNLGLIIMNTSLFACSVKYLWTFAWGLRITNGLKEWLKLIHPVRCLLELYTKPTARQLFTGYRGVIIAMHYMVIRAVDKPYFTIPPPLALVALRWCWCTLTSPLLCDGILQFVLFLWLVLFNS